MAVSAPVEAKDELAETGLEALGAQPVADAPSPALEVAERGVGPGENFMGGLSPTTWGWWRSRGAVLQPLQPSVLTIAVAAVLRTAKLPRSLALQDRIVASRRRPGVLPSPSSSAPATGILPSGLRLGPEGAPLSRCGRLASPVSTRPRATAWFGAGGCWRRPRLDDGNGRTRSCAAWSSAPTRGRGRRRDTGSRSAIGRR